MYTFQFKRLIKPQRSRAAKFDRSAREIEKAHAAILLIKGICYRLLGFLTSTVARRSIMIQSSCEQREPSRREIVLSLSLSYIPRRPLPALKYFSLSLFHRRWAV